MNTRKVDEESLQILSEGSFGKQENDKRKDEITSGSTLPILDSEFIKKIEITLRPDRHAMDALIACLRKSYITYRLISLIQLFLEKKDRFEIFLTALQPDVLFCTQNENLPFLSKEGAFDYLIEKYWSDIFEKEIVHLSPIRGNFASVNRCGITNVLLGPPNYHLYNDLIKEHYTQYLIHDYSWEFFIQQIKNEHDPLLIKQWYKDMSEHVVFRLKSDPQICFDSSHAAQKYLQKHPALIKDSVKPYNAFSLSYADVVNLKDELLKKQIYQKIKDEFHSPISLGCFCRTRFRHAGLHLYKKRKGASYTSFLCSIKRKVRNENNDSLSDELSHIVDYIEQHPLINKETCIADFCSVTTFSAPSDSFTRRENLIKADLIMLIKMGYVTQFEDGSLYVSPKQMLRARKKKVM